MTNKTISQLPNAALPLVGDEQIPLVQSSITAKATIASLYAGSSGSSFIGYLPPGTGAIATTAQNKFREIVSVKDFGAIGDGVIDDTTAIQNAINFGMESKGTVFLPAGDYKITNTLSITDEICFQGDGSFQSKIVLHTTSTSTVAMLVDMGNNTSFIGARIGGFGIRCNGGTARGIGLRIQTTATNSAVSNCVFEEMFINHVNIGISMTGVIYMSTFRNITISGNVDSYGWYVDTAQEVIYNSYEDLEVTNVNNNAWAYYFAPATASQFRNLTADGCCYFAGAYTGIKGLTIEGIYATTTPSIAAITINQIASISNVALINIPNSKCSQGIFITSANTEVSCVRFPDSGVGNQPNTPILWGDNQKGVLSGVKMDRAPVNKLEAAMSESTLNGFLIFNCPEITSHNLTYFEGTWTPAFTTWSTAPSVSSAKYIRVGNLVTVFLSHNGGVCADYSTITGLPFTSSSAVGGTATSVGGDLVKRFTGVIGASSTAIITIPAQTLTGVFSQLTATYFAQ